MMIDVAVKITALLSAGWVVSYLLRGRAASTRHAVWTGLLAATLTLPLFGAIAPRIELAWLPANPPAMQQSDPAPALSDAMVIRQGPAPKLRVERPAMTPTQAAAGVWLLVAFVLAGRTLAAHARARAMLKSCVDPPDALVHALAAVGAELDVRLPALRLAPAGSMPAVTGVLRAAVILPAEATQWTAERLRAVLLHECAHVRRRDALLQVIASIATAVYWWHPLAWLAARRMVHERELACDDLVLASGTPGSDYAEHLLDIARALEPSRRPALAMARASELEGRLIALLEERPRQSRQAPALLVGVTLALAAVSIVAPIRVVAGAGPAVPDAPAPPADMVLERASPRAEAAAVEQAVATPAQERPAAPVDQAKAATAPQVNQAMIDALAGAVADDDENVRLVGLAALARSSAPEAVPTLLSALQDPSEDIRALALVQLIHLERPEIMSHLTEAVQDESSDVRRAAVMGLSRMDHQERVPLLLQAAADPSEDVRTMAALGLEGVEGRAVDELLVELSRDESPDVRRAAILAIARRIGDAGIRK